MSEYRWRDDETLEEWRHRLQRKQDETRGRVVLAISAFQGDEMSTSDLGHLLTALGRTLEALDEALRLTDTAELAMGWN